MDNSERLQTRDSDTFARLSWFRIQMTLRLNYNASSVHLNTDGSISGILVTLKLIAASRSSIANDLLISHQVYD